MLAPFIMTDELTYSELGRSLAAARSLEIRDVPISGYGVLYPLLIAPAYALFDSLTDAYAAVKVINSLAMSLAAIPTYLIARRVAGTGLALLAALLAVALPSLVYTATVMTENLYYPLALVVMWMTLVVLSRPTWRNTVLLCVALGLALATRTQAVALGAGIVFAPLVLAVLEGSRLVRVRAAWRLYALLGGAAALVLAAQLARGHSVSSLLGAYGVVGDRSYDLATVLRYWLWHAEELTLYLGVVPVAATLVLLGRARRLPASAQEHLAVTVSFSVWTTLVVAAFASEFAGRIQERNTFAIAPLFLVALVAWVSVGAPRPWPLAAVATARRGRARRRVPVRALHRRAGQVGHARDSPVVVGVRAHGARARSGSACSLGALALAALFLLVPARWAVLVPLAVLLWFGIVGKSVWSGPRGFVQAGAGALFQGIRGAPRDWIDAALPPERPRASSGRASPTASPSTRTSSSTAASGRSTTSAAPTPGTCRRPRSLSTRRTASCDAPTGRRSPTATSSPTPRSSSTARAVARDIPLGITLWRVARACCTQGRRRAGRGSTRTTPGRAHGQLRAPELLARGRCRSRSTAMRRCSTGRRRSRHRSPAPGWRGFASRHRTTPFSGCRSGPKRGVCRVRFDVSPTAVPGGGDTSAGSASHFDAFNYEPR